MTQTNNALVKHGAEGPGPGDILRGPVSIPPSDVSENGEAYFVYLEMPGAQKDAIVVTIAGEILVVRAPIAPVHVNDAAVLYQEAIEQWRELDMPLDLALCELDLVMMLGANHPDATVAKEAADIFAQIKTAPFARRLDAALS